MHVHTEHSMDGSVPLKVYARLARSLGLSGFAVTDHNTIDAHRDINAVSREYDVLIIPGVEISSSQGHIVAYMVNEDIPRMLEPAEVVDRVHEQGGYAVAAHPYRFWSGLPADVIKSLKFDAMEVKNARSSRVANLRAGRLYSTLKKKGTIGCSAGSDAHTTGEFGRAYVETEASSAEDIVKSIVAAKTICKGKSRSASGTARYVRKAVSEWSQRGFKRI